MTRNIIYSNLEEQDTLSLLQDVHQNKILEDKNPDLELMEQFNLNLDEGDEDDSEDYCDHDLDDEVDGE